MTPDVRGISVPKTSSLGADFSFLISALWHETGNTSLEERDRGLAKGGVGRKGFP